MKSCHCTYAIQIAIHYAFVIVPQIPDHCVSQYITHNTIQSHDVERCTTMVPHMPMICVNQPTPEYLNTHYYYIHFATPHTIKILSRMTTESTMVSVWFELSHHSLNFLLNTKCCLFPKLTISLLWYIRWEWQSCICYYLHVR